MIEQPVTDGIQALDKAMGDSGFTPNATAIAGRLRLLGWSLVPTNEIETLRSAKAFEDRKAAKKRATRENRAEFVSRGRKAAAEDFRKKRDES